MKKFVVISVVLAGTIFAICAYGKGSESKLILHGTVVRVERHEAPERLSRGDNPSDAPMADPEVFAYDVTVRVNCGTYVGRYQSWYDHIPSVLRVDEKIQLRLARSTMYVAVPNERDVELSIVSKRMERGPCEAAGHEVASR